MNMAEAADQIRGLRSCHAPAWSADHAHDGRIEGVTSGRPHPAQIPARHVPACVVAIADGRPVRLLWDNEAGGLAFMVGTGPDRCFVKWAPAGSGLDLSSERARLAWAARYTPVPRPLGQGADDAGAWLITTALPGENAISPRWLADPRTAVTALGTGLRALHESLPVPGCPFSWTAPDRLADARRRAAEGVLDPARWHEIHQGLGVSRALELAAHIPPADRLVVCHGDPCAPNTLLSDDGQWSAHVDLGALGVADRWADLAVATWSTEWNYGPGWDTVLLDAYGVQPDPDRTRYYRLLYDLGP
jgi:kanamycin kinase